MWSLRNFRKLSSLQTSGFHWSCINSALFLHIHLAPMNECLVYAISRVFFLQRASDAIMTWCVRLRQCSFHWPIEALVTYSQVFFWFYPRLSLHLSMHLLWPYRFFPCLWLFSVWPFAFLRIMILFIYLLLNTKSVVCVCGLCSCHFSMINSIKHCLS